GPGDAAQRRRGPLCAPAVAAPGGTVAAAAARAAGPAYQRRALGVGDTGSAGDRASSRRRWPGAGVPQPPRLRADAVVHGVRLDRALRRVRRAPHRAPGRGAPALSSLRRRRTAPAALSTVRFRRETGRPGRSEEHTSELQSLAYLVCRLLLEKKKTNNDRYEHNQKHDQINRQISHCTY